MIFPPNYSGSNMTTSMIKILDIQMDGAERLGPAPEKLEKQGSIGASFPIAVPAGVHKLCKDMNIVGTRGQKSLSLF